MNKFTFATAEEGFDNHIDQSIRGYSNLWNDVLKFSEYFVEDETCVVDIGCSTGKLLKEMKVQNDKSRKLTCAEHVFLYTSDGSIKDVKSFHQLNIENLTLLNPLTVLEFIKDEKVHEYNTLPLAETGNAFGGVDV